ncbi:hypothetical protein VCR1J2_20419 [Vibrio coralliirubri]|nr:hypothetical protein VCR1J2_20419 [Vibrio coralliirubri]
MLVRYGLGFDYRSEHAIALRIHSSVNNISELAKANLIPK